MIATRPGLGDTILSAFIARRTVLLSGASSSIRLIGSRYSPESLRLREFLARTQFRTSGSTPTAIRSSISCARCDVRRPLPVVIVSKSFLRRPTTGELAPYLGLTVDSLPERCVDLASSAVGPPVWRPRIRRVRRAPDPRDRNGRAGRAGQG